MTTDTRDTLFLRLCIRQGIFSQDDAKQLLAFYRDNRSHKEGIGEFLIRHEYLDAPTVEQLRGAIEKRADGHVTAPLPKRGKPTKGGARRSHGAGTYAAAEMRRKQGISASPGQMVAVGVALVALIGAVILIVTFMRAPSKTNSVTEDDGDKSESTSGAGGTAAKSKESEAPAFSEAQLQEFQTSVEQLINDSSQTFGHKGPAAAISQLNEGLERMRSENVPDSTLAAIVSEIAKNKEYRENEFEDQKKRYQRAKDREKTDTMEGVLDEIRERLGDEYADRLSGGGG